MKMKLSIFQKFYKVAVLWEVYIKSFGKEVIYGCRK